MATESAQGTTSNQSFYATGRRKESAARVWIKDGQGNMQVNGRSLQDYFTRESWQKMVDKPLELSELQGKIDICATVRGGGLSGQAGALLHGLARALVQKDTALRPLLKKNLLLRRDDRMVERKKPGQAGARKRFQYSKR
ncbi:MAG: 30S ribosomal protein S9 [Myxococcota bacterium]